MTAPLLPSRRPLVDILHSSQCIVASSVFDAVSARLAQAIGSDVGILGGSAASQTVLGAPDIVLLTATELVEQARRICRTNCVNLIVDADHGYGNALNVMRTIEDLQSVGVAATCLEDSVLPRAFDSDQTLRLISIEEGRQKMLAALQARANGAMLVLGRTNAMAATDVDDAIRRLQAYQAVGVDALFLPYLKRREDLDQIAAAVSLPLIVAGSDESLFDLDYLTERGVKIWMWGHQPQAIATAALFEAMKAAHSGVPPRELLKHTDPDTASIATATNLYASLTQRYLQKPHR